MDWAIPAALGCKLGKLTQLVVVMVGDGDFLMRIHKLATAAQYNPPIMVIVLNNFCWQSITDLQIDAYGLDHDYATRFLDRQGRPYSPCIADAGNDFGHFGQRIEQPTEIHPAIQKALQQGGPAIIEILVARDYPMSSGVVAG